jgi:hypothetical protein
MEVVADDRASQSCCLAPPPSATGIASSCGSTATCMAPSSGSILDSSPGHWTGSNCWHIHTHTRTNNATDGYDPTMKKRRTMVVQSGGGGGGDDDDSSGKRQRRCGQGSGLATDGPWGCHTRLLEQIPVVMSNTEEDEKVKEDSHHLVEEQSMMDLSSCSASDTENGVSIHQHILDQYAKGSGGLLRDDRHLLEDHSMEDVLQCFNLQDQADWLEGVVHARTRAQAWDASQYTRERNVLQNWLR